MSWRRLLSAAAIVCIVIFTGSWVFAFSAFSRGLYRYETRADFPDNGQSVLQTGGQVYITDGMVGLEVDIYGAQDGEKLTWRWIRPDGTIKGANSLTYDYDTDCWISTYSLPTCGDADHPFLDDVIWEVAASFNYETPGSWLVECENRNGVIVEPFELVPLIFRKYSGDNQIIAPSTSSTQPLQTQLLYPDGVTPFAGEPVVFTLTQQPDGAKAGLAEVVDAAGSASITAATDANGVASAYFTGGKKAGAYLISASSIAAPGDQVDFAITVGGEEIQIGKNTGDPDCEAPRGGNPIHAAIGNKYQVETDYSGAGAFPLEFKRHYNSVSTFSGALGANWRGSYDRSISRVNNKEAVAYRPDGKEYKFKLSRKKWVCDPDVTDRLEQTANGWRYTTSEDFVEIYDANGRLVSISNRAGLLQTLSYDDSGKLVSVTDPFGRSLVFAWSADGCIQTMREPAGGLYTYAYDADNRLTGVTKPDLKTRTYLYENAAYPNALTGIIDENSIRFATWTYDDQGRAVSSEHAGGAEKVTIDYKYKGLSTVLDSLGSEKNLAYTVVQGVAKTTSMDVAGCSNCGGQFSESAYDDRGFLISRTDFNGNRSVFEYNDRGLQTSRTEAVGSPEERTIATAWHPDFRLPVLITEPGRITSFTYDARGLLTQHRITDTATSASRTWTYAYNNKGLRISADGPRNDVLDITTYEYDDFGNLISVENALGHVTQMPVYDAHGRPLQIVDPNGLVTVLTYDELGRVISRNVGGETTGFAYDGAGNLTRITMPDGSFLNHQYDDAHRLVGISDASGNYISYTLDSAGNIVSQNVFDPSHALAQARNWAYDELGRMTDELGAQGQTITAYGYDANGNRTSATDGLNHTVVHGFDALNRLSQTTDPLAGVTQYGYDAQDNIIRVEDPKGLATTFQYNGFGDLIQQSSPDTGVSYFTYDAAGNMHTATDANNHTTAYAYDALNRLTGATYADGAVETYVYDDGQNAAGRLSSIADASGMVRWSYNLHGRIVEKRQETGGLVLITGYGYDAFGRLSNMTYPSGAVVNLSYVNGRIANIRLNGQPLASDVRHVAFGPVSGWTFANGGVYSRSYDLDARMSQHSLGGLTRTIEYDPSSRISGLSDAQASYGFEYDASSRLTRAYGTGLDEGFAYDKNGNRTSFAESGVSYPYAYVEGTNRLLSVDGPAAKHYAYDAVGNILSDGVHVYGYDARNRLTRLNDGQFTYRINAQGLRVCKESLSEPAVYFTYDEGGQLIGEYDASGNAIRETVWLGNIPVAVVASGSVYYTYADHLNTPRLIENANGTTVWKWNLDPFGALPPDEDPDGDGVSFEYNLRFPGQYFDQESGLHYNWHRYYDPNIGRYLRPDPIGLEGGINPYPYVLNDPVNMIDPEGLKCGTWWNDWLVSDKPGGFDFSSCCQQHDDCYDKECNKN
ncbi:MAG: DUF6531 domain-containing protein, partial [Desulfobacterales bacterium]|nr:DUF6531 domain-containing protein [Desulfobacterales bacterium]